MPGIRPPRGVLFADIRLSLGEPDVLLPAARALRQSGVILRGYEEHSAQCPRGMPLDRVASQMTLVCEVRVAARHGLAQDAGADHGAQDFDACGPGTRLTDGGEALLVGVPALLWGIDADEDSHRGPPPQVRPRPPGADVHVDDDVVGGIVVLARGRR